MKSEDKKVSISIRKLKNKEVLQLRRLPITKKDKKILTGDAPTEENWQKYIQGGLVEWQRLTNPVNDITFAFFAERALQEFNAHVTKDTKNDREKHLREYINPTFGNLLIRDLTYSMVNPWQESIKAQKGADYARRVKSLFGRIIRLAIVRGQIANDITIGSARIKGDSKKIREIYSKEEINLMISESTGWLRLFIVVRAYLWLRSAETIGIKWDDVDWMRRTIHIQRGIRWGRFKKVKGGNRVIEIPPIVLEALQEHKKTSTSDWIFTTDRHNDYWGDCANINTRHFQPFLKKIGIRYKTSYSLRHTGATFTLFTSGDWVGTQVKLGHRKLSTTTDFYIKPVSIIGSAIHAENAFK